jgi:hypothetical protein
VVELEFDWLNPDLRLAVPIPLRPQRTPLTETRLGQAQVTRLGQTQVSSAAVSGARPTGGRVARPLAAGSAA